MLHLWNVALTFIFLFMFLTPVTRMTQRDGMGKEPDGGSGRGTHVDPWQIQVNVWQNQNNVVKSNK